MSETKKRKPLTETMQRALAKLRMDGDVTYHPGRNGTVYSCNGVAGFNTFQALVDRGLAIRDESGWRVIRFAPITTPPTRQ